MTGDGPEPSGETGAPDGEVPAPLPDTPSARVARRWLFRVLLLLGLVNLAVLGWAVLTGRVTGPGPGAP